MATYNGPGQFDGKYPTPEQQTQRAATAMSNAIHSAGMQNKGPVVPYRSKPGSNKLIPTGAAEGKRWGELTRKDIPGKDIWGGTENPSLPFSGKVAQKSDYWHQMAEQPKSSGPKTTSKAPSKKTTTTQIPVGPSQPRGFNDPRGSIRPDKPIKPGSSTGPGGSGSSSGSSSSSSKARPTGQIGPIIGRGYNGGRP